MNIMKAHHTTAVALFTLLAVALTTLPAQAQRGMSEKELQRQPGYVEFGDLWKWSDGDEEVEIHLTQPLLGVAGSFVRGEDPDLAELIQDLHLVKVNQFSFSRGDDESVRGFVDDTASVLRDDGWDNIVKVRERNERINVFVKMEGDGSDPTDTFLSGLCVLVLERDSATFVNVVGRFRLEDIARVGSQFDIPYAEDWDRYDRRGSRRRDRDNDDDDDDNGGGE